MVINHVEGEKIPKPENVFPTKTTTNKKVK